MSTGRLGCRNASTKRYATFTMGAQKKVLCKSFAAPTLAACPNRGEGGRQIEAGLPRRMTADLKGGWCSWRSSRVAVASIAARCFNCMSAGPSRRFHLLRELRAKGQALKHLKTDVRAGLPAPAKLADIMQTRLITGYGSGHAHVFA